MGWGKRAWSVFLLGLMIWPAWSATQTLPQTTEDALHQMARMAGVIFTGQVVGVRRLPGADGSAGVVEIVFAVQDAVCGVSGGTYTLREWAGLWPANDEPFRVGQRYLMLLHAAGAAGLSSPIGGMDGAIPIHGGATVRAGAVRLEEAARAQSSTAGTGDEIDLSWVATRVVTPVAYQAASFGKPILGTGPVTIHAEAVKAYASTSAETLAGNGALLDAPSESESASGSASGLGHVSPYGTVVGLLRGWEASDHASH